MEVSFHFMQVRYYESKEVGVCGNLCLCVWEGAVCVCESTNWQNKILHNNSVKSTDSWPREELTFVSMVLLN